MSDPLTGGNSPGTRKMAVSLLTYANRAKVADALTQRGYPVTRVTVNRWAAGAEMPGIAERMIAELFLHDTTKEAAPDVPERLEAAVIRLEELVSGAAWDSLIARLAARLGLPPPPHDVPPPSATQVPADSGHTGPPRRG